MQEGSQPDFQPTEGSSYATELKVSLVNWVQVEGVQLPPNAENLDVNELLSQLDNATLQKLQAELAYVIAKHSPELNVNDVNPEKLKAVGSILYTEQPVARGKGMRNGFTENTRKPALLRPRHSGSVHIFPYGRGQRVRGKETESLLMLADDWLTLLDTFKKQRKGFPRYIYNVTNQEMAEVCQKYLGAQARPLNQFEGGLLSVMRGSQRNTENPHKVFVPETTLRDEEIRAEIERVENTLYWRLRESEEESQEDVLKRVRIDAINYMLATNRVDLNSLAQAH